MLVPFQQNETEKAVSVLVKCVRHKFAAVNAPQDSQTHSLATVSSDDQSADPVALYRRLLSQPLPYDYKCPPLMPGVNSQSLGREKLFLWLSYWYGLIHMGYSPSVRSRWLGIAFGQVLFLHVYGPRQSQGS